jgi:hypothetical protein
VGIRIGSIKIAVRGIRWPAIGREQARDWAFSLGCILAGLAGLRVVNDGDLWKKFSLGSDQALKAGVFRRLEGGVRVKPNESMLWHDLAEDSQEVFGGDTVFTGDDGRGEIVFNDGSTAQVLPQSLIVIRPAEAAPDSLDWFSNLGRSVIGAGPVAPTRIKVVQGGVKVRLKAKAPPPVVMAEDQVLPISTSGADGAGETEVEFKVDPSKAIHITSTSGALVGGTALLPGAERVIGQAAVPAPAAPVAPPVVAAAPAAPAVQVAASPEPVALASPEPAAASPTPVVAEASPAPAAEPVATPKPKPKIVALPTLEVKAGGGSTIAVDYDHLEQLSVRLRWKDVPGVASYDVKVTDDRGRPGGNAHLKKPSFELVLKSLKTVNYFYVVEAKLETGEVIRSPKIPIKIELSAPLLKSPSDGYQYAASEDRLMTWAKLNGGTDFQRER